MSFLMWFLWNLLWDSLWPLPNSWDHRLIWRDNRGNSLRSNQIILNRTFDIPFWERGVRWACVLLFVKIGSLEVDWSAVFSLFWLLFYLFCFLYGRIIWFSHQESQWLLKPNDSIVVDLDNSLLEGIQGIVVGASFFQVLINQLELLGHLIRR